MSDFRISVIIPAWNCEPYLSKTINFILSQTYPPMEIIISDDESSDRTAEVARSFGDKVRYYWHAHCGCGASRNYAIQRANGDWIAVFDADDEWLPHKLERQVEYLAANPGLKWSSCNYETVYLHKDRPDQIHRITRAHFSSGVKDLLTARKPMHFFRYGHELPVCPSSMLMHRSLFDELGLFDESLPLMEDRDMWWRIALRYPMIAYPVDVSCRYFKNIPGAMTDFNVRGAGRDVEGRILLRHLKTAREIGGQTECDYMAFGGQLAHDYIFRVAGGHATMEAELFEQLRKEFPLSIWHRVLCGVAVALPKPLARKWVDHFRL